jgi:high-affinity iron transporter
VGSFLKALFGYNGNPSLTELLAYFGYFTIVLLGIRKVARDQEFREFAV